MGSGSGRQPSARQGERPENRDRHDDDADEHPKDPLREEQQYRAGGCQPVAALARKVDEKDVKLVQCPSRKGVAAPLVEFVHAQPAGHRVAAQLGRYALAIGVRSPNGAIAHDPDLIPEVEPGLERGTEVRAGEEVAMLALKGVRSTSPAFAYGALQSRAASRPS
jgi:hypothetical protein